MAELRFWFWAGPILVPAEHSFMKTWANARLCQIAPSKTSK
jgi:hypothetical protein